MRTGSGSAAISTVPPTRASVSRGTVPATIWSPRKVMHQMAWMIAPIIAGVWSTASRSPRGENMR